MAELYSDRKEALEVEKLLESYGQKLREQNIPTAELLDQFWSNIAPLQTTRFQRIRRWIFPGFGLVFAAFAFVVLGADWFQPTETKSGSYLTPKSFPVLMYHAYQKEGRTYSKSKVTQDGTMLSPGDAVQFGYTSLQSFYVMVVSMEQGGRISSYVPLRKSIVYW